jgi:hypothetical protein
VSTKPSQKSPTALSAKSWKYLLLLIATFVYFNAGADWMRAEKGQHQERLRLCRAGLAAVLATVARLSAVRQPRE